MPGVNLSDSSQNTSYRTPTIRLTQPQVITKHTPQTLASVREREYSFAARTFSFMQQIRNQEVESDIECQFRHVGQSTDTYKCPNWRRSALFHDSSWG